MTWSGGPGFAMLESMPERFRVGMSDAGHMIGEELVRRARDGILNGAKSGRYYDTNFFTIGSGAGRRVVAYGSRDGHQASAPGEYSANDTGNLLNSINYELHGIEYITFFARSAHAAYQEYGTDRMGARPNLEKAIEESDGFILELLQQIVMMAMGGG